MNLQMYLRRLKNPAVIMGISGYVISIINNMGFSFDNQAVLGIINGICSILVLLGILNNPETKGIDLPGKKIKK